MDNNKHQKCCSRIGARFIGATFKSNGTIHSDLGLIEKTSNNFILVDGGDSDKADKIAEAMLVAAKMNLCTNVSTENTETKFIEQMAIAKPVIITAIQEAISTAHATAEELKSTFLNGSITILVTVADIALCAQKGTARSYFRDNSKKSIFPIFDETPSSSIIVKEVRLSSGDMILLCTDGFWHSCTDIVPLLSSDPKGIASALKATRKIPSLTDRSAYICWLDYPWHAAAKMGFIQSAEAIANCQIFKNLTFNEVCSLLKIAQLKRYSVNSLIVSEGDRADSLFVLVSGELSVFSSTGIFRVRNAPGDCIGELAFLDEQPRSAFARATTPCEILVFDNKLLKGHIEQYPTLGNKVLFALGGVAAARVRERTDDKTIRPSVLPTRRTK